MNWSKKVNFKKKLLFPLLPVLMLVANNGEAQATVFEWTESIVDYTVPQTGIYDITAYGAQGGMGANGGEIGGAFSLTQGKILQILVGSVGVGGGVNETNGYLGGGGGGGGSFVALGTSPTADSPLVVAGGGGGGSGYGGGIGLGVVGGATTAGSGNGGFGGATGITLGGGSGSGGGGGGGFFGSGFAGLGINGTGTGGTGSGGGGGSFTTGGLRGTANLTGFGAGGFGGGGGGDGGVLPVEPLDDPLLLPPSKPPGPGIGICPVGST